MSFAAAPLMSKSDARVAPSAKQVFMLTVGDKFPQYHLKAVVSVEAGHEFEDVSSERYGDKWRIYFFWPMDFTFVCPTEIEQFALENEAFLRRGAQVLGASTDTHY